MKKFVVPFFLAFWPSIHALFAQNVDMAADSVTKILCRKWKVNYFIYNGMKMSPKPGVQLIFNFMRNNTFNSIEETDFKYKYDSANKYTWRFDSLKKVILLKTDVENTKIISLKDDELIMLTDLPEDPAGIKTVYIPAN